MENNETTEKDLVYVSLNAAADLTHGVAAGLTADALHNWIQRVADDLTEAALMTTELHKMDGELQQLNIPIGDLHGWLSMKFFTGEYRKFPELVRKFGEYESVTVASTPDKLYINGIEAAASKGMFSFALPKEWIEEMCNLMPECPTCKGTGRVWSLGIPGLRNRCDDCDGTGQKRDD